MKQTCRMCSKEFQPGSVPTLAIEEEGGVPIGQICPKCVLADPGLCRVHVSTDLKGTVEGAETLQDALERLTDQACALMRLSAMGFKLVHPVANGCIVVAMEARDLPRDELAKLLGQDGSASTPPAPESPAERP